jgi:hypothetical protein
VDVRAVLVRSVRNGLIDAASARLLRGASAQIHYRDRTWIGVLAAGEQMGLRLDHFAAWLATHDFSQKANDARTALDLALELAVEPPMARPEPPITDFIRIAARRVAVDLDRP